MPCSEEPKNTSSIFSSFATARTVKEPASRAHRQGLFIMTQISSSPMVHILTCRCLTTKSSRQQPCSLCRPYSSDLMWLMMMMMMMEMDDDDDDDDYDADDDDDLILNDDFEWWWWWMMMMMMTTMMMMMINLMHPRIFKNQDLRSDLPCMPSPNGPTAFVSVGKAILPEVHCANGHCLRSNGVWLSGSNLWLGDYNSFKELRFILVNSILKRGLQNGSGH